MSSAGRKRSYSKIRPKLDNPSYPVQPQPHNGPPNINSKRQKANAAGAIVQRVAAAERFVPADYHVPPYSSSLSTPTLRTSATDSSFFCSARNNVINPPKRLPYQTPTPNRPDNSTVEVEMPEETKNLTQSEAAAVVDDSVREKECLSQDVWPTIWAQSRQELCESFQWFRSYQSGVYFSQGYVKGYLLGAFSASRDLWHNDGKLIISHGGGKAKSVHCSKGRLKTQKASDQQEDDKSVRALLKNMEEERPIALVIDDGYALFPKKLRGVKNGQEVDIGYAVLGYYKIAHAWAEKQLEEDSFVVRWKFAFSWCEEQGMPWWQAKSIPRNKFTAPRRSAQNLRPVKIAVRKSLSKKDIQQPHLAQLHTNCSVCERSSPQVYKQAWTCLRPSCEAFWDFANGEPSSETSDYNPEFLLNKPEFKYDIKLEELLPPPPPTDGETTSYPFSRGWHCRVCGRLSCRWKWEHWECAHCQTTVAVVPKLKFAKEVDLKIDKDYYILDSSEVKLHPAFRIDHPGATSLCQAFELKKGGCIFQIRHKPFVASTTPDRIFQLYQEQAADGSLPFRRWPLRTHKLKGPMLTHYFSQNCGEPYQYVGGADNTLPWEQAPSAVQEAREFIQERVSATLSHVDKEIIRAEFNEVLSAAYMQEQRMAFHSDAEVGLGPVVAGLSLGAPAEMHFRVHIPGKQAKKKLDAPETMETEAPEDGAPGGPHAVKANTHGKRERVAFLKLVLRHGDILMMNGAEVQTCYEHAVVPKNFRIAATARYIESAHHAAATTKPSTPGPSTSRRTIKMEHFS